MDSVSGAFVDPELKHLRSSLNSYIEGAHDNLEKFLEDLQTVTSTLAQDEQYRRTIGAENSGVWAFIRDLWRLAIAETTNVDEFDESQAALCLGVARFTRNIVAGVPSNQFNALENESSICTLVYRFTSYLAVQNSDTYPVTRMLIQTLSNLATGNDAILAKLWKTYLALPEEQLVLLRLLTSPDAKTVSSTLVFITNCIHENDARMNMLVFAPRGPRIVITILDRINSMIHSRGADENQAFTIGFGLFTRLTEAGLIPAVYQAISMSGEPIVPPQTTLLKLLDSYLHKASQGLQDKPRNDALVRMLIDAFFQLASYAQNAIKRALGSADDPQGDSMDVDGEALPLKELDLLLPKVSEALVLVSQCLTTLALSEAEQPVPSSVKANLVAARSPEGEGLVESLIETLRLLDIFLPRIMFGKIVQRPAPPGMRPPTAEALARPQAGVEGFSFVKRDLVRLLGIIVLDDKGAQDRVRECGGIPVVMNLCVIDDRNPYMKEHAILALRNLLHGNQTNQDTVKEIQPVARWDDRGVLQSLS